MVEIGDEKNHNTFNKYKFVIYIILIWYLGADIFDLFLYI